MVFVFYQFNSSPLNFNPSAIEDLKNSEYASEYYTLENEKQVLEKLITTKQLAFAASDITSEQEVIITDIKSLNNLEKDLREQTK